MNNLSFMTNAEGGEAGSLTSSFSLVFVLGGR